MKCLARDVKVRSTMNHLGLSELDFYNSFMIEVMVNKNIEHTGS